MTSTTRKHRRRIAMVAAGTTAAALLLGACGSNSKQTNADPSTIAGAQSSSATASPTPSPSSSLPAAVLPAGLTFSVEGGSTGNATKDAALAANLSFYQAEYQAVGRQNADDSLYQSWTGQFSAAFNAKASTREYIQRFVSRGITATGVIRLYDRKVVSITGSTAQLTWCEDKTKEYAKVVKTNKVNYTTPSRTDYAYYQSTESYRDGRWLTTAIQGKESDPRCS